MLWSLFIPIIRRLACCSRRLYPIASLQTWIVPRISGAIPQARNAQTVTPVQDKLFLFGGHSGIKHLKDLHIFDTNLLQWSEPKLRGSVPPGLRGHTANLIGNTIYLFGA